VGGLRAQERQCGPVTLEDVLIEEADTAGADAHRGRSEAIDVFAVQEVSLKLLFGDHSGRFAVELSQQADFSDIGLLRPFARAAEVERRNHLLA
jgi:hypothetical protein